ncbi:bile acid:sodium symporter family protein [Marinobacterium sp. D7]|uniref:bile acid:sodium symporter family protein n=1 Tax=Marinobacterium ramblicola TaxID=2849041 RepID=UPI001C2D8903|nr:bile acid:sodium symporter [Marinobacterium ramblicola]MBV1786484.1 bile acid:sodium symporter family protein [Marinobacterium ramblicola]
MEASSLSQLVLPAALFMMMLGIGITLQGADFKRVFTAPRGLLLGAIGQLALLPLLGVLVCGLFALPPLVAAGLMIVTFAPGGVTSNMITLISRGDMALSVSLTALSSLVAPFTLPLLTALVLAKLDPGTQLNGFPLLPSIVKLATVTLLPVLLGLALRTRFPLVCQRLQPVVKVLAVLGFVLIVVGIVRANWERLPALLALYAPAVMVLAVIAMALGALLARMGGLGPAGQRTLAIEVGIQNAGTALMVSSSLLGSVEMSAIVLIYGVLMQVPAALLMIFSNLPVRPGVVQAD